MQASITDPRIQMRFRPFVPPPSNLGAALRAPEGLKSQGSIDEILEALQALDGGHRPGGKPKRLRSVSRLPRKGATRERTSIPYRGQA